MVTNGMSNYIEKYLDNTVVTINRHFTVVSASHTPFVYGFIETCAEMPRGINNSIDIHRNPESLIRATWLPNRPEQRMWRGLE